MIKSVGKNKGFYVGRYETSLREVNSEKIAQSKKGETSATAASSSANKWYGLYQKEKEYSEKNSLTSIVGSSMIWGSQYDQMMIWMQKNGYNVASTTPKDGVSYNDSQTTGKSGNPDVMNNVNDLIGCYCEWTLEANNTGYRVYRGALYSDSDSPKGRGIGNPDIPFAGSSSRLALYVK